MEPDASNPLSSLVQMCCIVCGYKTGEEPQDCNDGKKDHSWAGDHACSSDNLRCSSWLSGQFQAWSQHRKNTGQSLASDSLTESDISSQGPNKGPRTPELGEFLAGVNPRMNQAGTPGINNFGGLINSQRQLDLSRWDSPLHQRVGPLVSHDSPRPFSSQKSHHRPVHDLSPRQFSISLNPTQCGSPRQITSEVRRQAMLNKKNNSLTRPDTPMPQNDSVDVQLLDNTETLVRQPPNVAYSPQFDYELNKDYSRLEANGSPFNYNPSEMTFCKRKFNSSYGSDQSLLNRTPIKHVAKRRKLDISGTLGLDKTWKPEHDDGKDLDKTWMPSRIPSDSDDDDNIDPTCNGKSLDTTWMPEGIPKDSDIENVEDEMFTESVFMNIPIVCTNCLDNQKPVAWCKVCSDDPYLCDPCVWAHKRVGITKRHKLLYKKQSSTLNKCKENNEDPMTIFENILNSVYPRRKINLSSELSSSSESDFEAPRLSNNFLKEVQMIRQNSSSLSNCLSKSNSGHPCADSITGGLGCHDIEMPGAFSRSSSENNFISRSPSTVASKSSSVATNFSSMDSKSSSVASKSIDKARKYSSSDASKSSSEASKTGVKVSALTERIMVDNLLPILNVDSDEVKAKTAVVIEMLVRNNLVNPSLFCDDRCMRGFKSLLLTPDRKLLKTALSSLDHLVSAVGQKGIIFSLIKIKTELLETLMKIKEDEDVQDSVSLILNRFDRFLGL